MAKRQIKSRERIVDHGEVFTAEREVNAMLDLVKDESERIDSRFLEPACGDGNFVAAILKRKLTSVARKYGKSPSDYERYSIVALTSIYGIDIMEDNIIECRKRLYDAWNKEYDAHCGNETDDGCRNAAQYILDRNILCGDALTMLRSDNTPIIFFQWDLAVGNKMKRRDYRLDQLMCDDAPQMSLTYYAYRGNFEYDTMSSAWIPHPIAEYPLMDYREVQYADQA